VEDHASVPDRQGGGFGFRTGVQRGCESSLELLER
jgi:hypothetical protein